MKRGIVLAILLLWKPGLLSAADTRPNIVFIFADDWGWGDLSCHGHPWLKTPNLDRLASQGIDFLQFNVLNPVCSPSRTAAMTGRYPARYCIHEHFAAPELNRPRGMPDWLDPHAPMLPRLLKQAGYRTGHFGKWHLTNAETKGAPMPAAYGFDEAIVFNGGQEWSAAGLHDAAPNAVRFIHANKEAPFFVNVWLHESHTPHVPTTRSMESWNELDLKKQVYSAVITDGDNAVGMVLDALEDAGVAENTLVIFSSDNGPESTSPGASRTAGKANREATGYDTSYSIGSTGGLRGRKRSLFEGGVRVPFLIRWPRHAPPGMKNNDTVLTAVDLLPTLCAAAGVTVPSDVAVDGENMLDAFHGKAAARTRPIFWEWKGTRAEPDWWPRLAVREGAWKLYLTADAKRVELYHLPEDHAETANVAGSHPDVVSRLSQMALDWKRTLPEKPNPDCLTKEPLQARTAGPRKSGKGVSAETRAKAFARWDTNKDDVLTLEEYKAGLNGQENLDARFRNFDTDGDGKLTRTEFVISTE